MRLTQKLLLIFGCVLVLSVLVLTVPAWKAMHDQVVLNMQNELKAIAATAALSINGDLHRQIRDGTDADSEAFQTLREQLARVQIANNIALTHIYTLYPDGDQMRFAVMLNPIDELFIGEPYPRQQAMVPVLRAGTVTASDLYPDEYGEWISAYAPIRDSSGEIVGLLEVDKDSEIYTREFRYYTRLSILLGAIALITSALLSSWVLQRLVIRPIFKIREGMLALGRRDFAHRVELQTNDELQDLGQTLNAISRQLDVVRMIQAGFFPKELPDFEGYRIAAESIPCDATGGDYYDAFPIDDGRLALVVADVSGHGLGPSLLMATCRSALRGMSMADLSPGNLVDRLAHLMVEDLTGGRFITLFFGVLSKDGTLTFANYGHGPALLASGGHLQHLESHQPPLGIMLESTEQERESIVVLHSGDRLLLATDGLTEAMDSHGEQLGLAPVVDILLDRSSGAPEVVRRLHDLLIGHCGGPSRTDDVTILCVDRL